MIRMTFLTANGDEPRFGAIKSQLFLFLVLAQVSLL